MVLFKFQSMNNLLKINIVIFFAFNFAYSQSKTTEPCKVETPPVLRGFILGQTVEQINSKIPNFQSVFLNEQQSQSDPKFSTPQTEAGFVLLTDTDVFYPQPGQRAVSSSDYEDVGFYWHFLDGKLMFISVEYNEFEPPTIRNFVKQVADKTNLPAQSWIFKDRNHAVLNCVGFMVDVWTGRDAGRPEYQGYPSVMITDTVAEAELTRRTKAIETRNKTAEFERIRREKEKRTVFKP